MGNDTDASKHSELIQEGFSQKQPVRSSTRSIKRKRFDDELVESSLGSLQAERQTRRTRMDELMKDASRWLPSDDLLLINAVQQTNDLQVVHTGVTFSTPFSLSDIQERWYALLYDPIVSRSAVAAMKELHPEQVTDIHSNALWSKEEEKLLANIPATTSDGLKTFETLLETHSGTFHIGRTAASLHNHWKMMKHYRLLTEQKVQPLVHGDTLLTFSDAEEQLERAEQLTPYQDALEQELSAMDRQEKRTIRKLESELPKWQALVDGSSVPEFDSQTLAILKGRLVRYLMRSQEITVGRSTQSQGVDVDLSLEGPAAKVSRRQACIKLKPDGEFLIFNEGKRPLYIDGHPVLSGDKGKLHHNSVFEVCDLSFLFLVNSDLVASLHPARQ